MADTDPRQTEVSGDRRAVDRRRFIELCGKYAVVAPPAIGLLVSATEADAHCISSTNPNNIHTLAGCSAH